MLYEKIPHGTYTIEIHTDDESREINDEIPDDVRVGTWHRNYRIGERIEQCTEDELRETYGEITALPVYMIDHSGIALSCEPFGCRWDSGQVGWIWIANKDAGNFGDVDAALRSVVDTMSKVASGEVYGYVVKDADDENVGSCWGFIGRDAFMGKDPYALAEAKSEADAHLEGIQGAEVLVATGFAL